MNAVTVVVMTEFGRRVAENSSFGTDHGRGGSMLVMGGAELGNVLGEMPVIETGILVGPGDVPVSRELDQRAGMARGIWSSLTGMARGTSSFTGSTTKSRAGAMGPFLMFGSRSDPFMISTQIGNARLAPELPLRIVFPSSIPTQTAQVKAEV